MPGKGYVLELNSQATKDVIELRSFLLRVIKELLSREDDPTRGHTLAGALKGARSLEFSLPGGAYRAAYVVDEHDKTCIVFAVGPHENFYKLAERRFHALQR